jgi:hypothetical protein
MRVAPSGNSPVIITVETSTGAKATGFAGPAQPDRKQIRISK